MGGRSAGRRRGREEQEVLKEEEEGKRSRKGLKAVSPLLQNVVDVDSHENFV